MMDEMLARSNLAGRAFSRENFRNLVEYDRCQFALGSFPELFKTAVLRNDRGDICLAAESGPFHQGII